MHFNSRKSFEQNLPKKLFSTGGNRRILKIDIKQHLSIALVALLQ